MNKNKILFIHVPKTGGTSIASFLEKNNMDSWIREYPARHDPYFFMEKSNKITPDVFSFAVVRNPYTRAYSYYKHFNYQNNLKVSFKNFLEFVKEKRFFSKTPMISYPQTYYLTDSNNKISLTKIYRFENLKEFENDFSIKLPHLRKGDYNREEYYRDYTEENISAVLDIYQEDFATLGYIKLFI
jgi:hypothetical protein